MKKLLLFAGLTAATLSFVGCNKQEADYAGNDGKFTIRFVSPETKTTNDGLSTKWAEGDALTVFYAKAGTTDYSKNNEFKISSPEDGLANADITLASGSYDWYAFYPYNSYFKTPANNNDDPARTYIGGRSDRAQTQAGYDSMEHVAGSNVPVYGVVKGVSSSNDPVIQMKHIASVAEIVVTNKSGKAVTITGVDLSAPEGVDIVGQYNISFDADPVITPYNTYQSNTAKLTVNGGTALANGASAKFYLVVKPFQAKDLTVKVTTDAGSQEKSVSLSSAASFQAGHIKTLNVPFDKAETVTSSTIAQMLETKDGEAVISNEVLVVAKACTGVLVKEGNDYILVYDKTALADTKVGDKVVVKGTMATYNGARQITTPTVTVNSSGNTVKHPTAKDITDSFETYAATVAEYVSYTGVLSVSGNYYNINVGEITSRIGSILAPAAEEVDAVKALNKKSIEVTGYYLYVTSGKYFYVIATEVKEAEGTTPSGPEEAKINVTTTNVSLYEGDTKSLGASTNSTAAISYVSADTSIATVDSEGNVTGVSAGETTITLSVPAVGDQFTAAEKTVNVTVNPKSGTVDGNWVATAITSIKDGAQFVLVSTKEGASYAMSNDSAGNNKQPVAIPVTVSGSKLASVPGNVVWTMEKSGSSYVFHPGSDTESWLYVINNNNGLRCGDNENKLISWNSSIGYLEMNDGTNARNLGVYYASGVATDWRCYKVVEDGVATNIKDQTFTFYVKQ